MNDINIDKVLKIPKKKIRIVRVKDNTTIKVLGLKKVSEITKVPISTIQYNMNCNKIINGYKFYDY